MGCKAIWEPSHSDVTSEGVTVQTRMHGIYFGAMSQLRRKRIAVAECKWALTQRTNSFFYIMFALAWTAMFALNFRACLHFTTPLHRTRLKFTLC